jgi:hypothetical protein
MNEASKISLTINDQARKKLPNHLTLEKIIEFIYAQQLDEQTTTGLIELASTYPTNAFPSFKRNFSLMVQRTRAKRVQEERKINED